MWKKKKKSLTLNKKNISVFWKSQENRPLALLPAPKCLHPSFYSDSYGLGCPSTTWLFHWHYLPTIFSLALFTLWLATVQNWMLVALEKASLLTPLHKFGSSCWWSALPPSYNRFIVWNGGKWSHDINQVLWSVVCLSLIHIWRCRRAYACRSRWSPYH